MKTLLMTCVAVALAWAGVRSGQQTDEPRPKPKVTLRCYTMTEHFPRKEPVTHWVIEVVNGEAHELSVIYAEHMPGVIWPEGYRPPGAARVDEALLPASPGLTKEQRDAAELSLMFEVYPEGGKKWAWARGGAISPKLVKMPPDSVAFIKYQVDGRNFPPMHFEAFARLTHYGAEIRSNKIPIIVGIPPGE